MAGKVHHPPDDDDAGPEEPKGPGGALSAQVDFHRPPGPRDWVRDAQARFDAGDRSDEAQPWSDLSRARLAVFRAFQGAFGSDGREKDAHGLCRGGVMLLRVGQALSPVPEWRRALGALDEAMELVARSLGGVEIAVEELHPLARKENSVRPHLGGLWMNLAMRARQVVGEGNSLRGDILEALRTVEWMPGLLPVPEGPRAMRSAACARLGDLASRVPALASLLCPATGVAVSLLVLLEIAFGAEEPFVERDDVAASEHQSRRNGWGESWKRHSPLQAPLVRRTARKTPRRRENPQKRRR